MKEYEIKARGKPSQTFRLTGRDGPPGSTLISGVPAWLVRWVPPECVNSLMQECMNRSIMLPVSGTQQPATRGHPADLKPFGCIHCDISGYARSIPALKMRDGPLLMRIRGTPKGYARGMPATKYRCWPVLTPWSGTLGMLRGDPTWHTNGALIDFEECSDRKWLIFCFLIVQFCPKWEWNGEMSEDLN
jgi:hypothetical protein